MRIKKVIAFTLAACMALSAAAGCNSKSESTTPNSKATTSTSKVTGIGSNGLNIGTTINWDSLTPLRSNIGNDAPYAYRIYETLAKMTSEKKYEPMVAKSWDTKDGITYDITLYDYVTDSKGNKITASDIVWMIQECKKAGLKPCFAKVVSVKQTGDYTLQVKMKENMVGSFEQILTNTFVVSQKEYEASKDKFGTEYVSTSPYVLTKFVSGSVISFSKRKDYWQKEDLISESQKSNVEKISYTIIKEASQAGIALETGKIDGFNNMDPNTGTQFEKNSAYSIKAVPYANGYQLFFTGASNRPCGEDKELRQAIAYSIDVKGLITGAFAGYGCVMHDPVVNNSMGYLAKWDKEDYYTHDVAKAKSLLQKSKYKNQELVLLATSDTTSQRVSQMIQAYLLQIGAKCKLNLVDQALYTSTRLDGTKYDMTINHVGGDSLPDHWSIRYDSKAYKSGDATGRHDTTMDNLLYAAWTKDGFTEQNIDAVHNYLKENMYAFGMVQPKNMDIWRTNLGITKTVSTYKGQTDFVASVYSK